MEETPSARIAENRRRMMGFSGLRRVFDGEEPSKMPECGGGGVFAIFRFALPGCGVQGRPIGIQGAFRRYFGGIGMRIETVRRIEEGVRGVRVQSFSAHAEERCRAAP